MPFRVAATAITPATSFLETPPRKASSIALNRTDEPAGVVLARAGLTVSRARIAPSIPPRSSMILRVRWFMANSLRSKEIRFARPLTPLLLLRHHLCKPYYDVIHAHYNQCHSVSDSLHIRLGVKLRQRPAEAKGDRMVFDTR